MSLKLFYHSSCLWNIIFWPIYVKNEKICIYFLTIILSLYFDFLTKDRILVIANYDVFMILVFAKDIHHYIKRQRYLNVSKHNP